MFVRLLLLAVCAAPAVAQDIGAFLRGDKEAETALRERFPAPLDKAAFAQLEAAIRNAGTFAAPGERLLTFDVPMPGAPALGVRLRLPPKYTGKEPTPLVVAFGGGPIAKGARGDAMVSMQARLMESVWRGPAGDAGYLLAAVRDGISRADPGIRYEIVRPRHLEILLKEIRRRVNVNEDRTFMTGISLGSNYALACGAARPHLFCGAVPASTEGEGRTPLLRNLRNYPLYVLTGVRDRNIRGIAGPRALDAILTRLGYAHTYEEYAERGHEGFEERYPDALRWFATRPRRFWAREVVRVSHDGIMAPDRTFYWITCDTRQASVRARVEGNTIRIEAASVSRLELLLSDHLVDLDRPVVVRINGDTVHEGSVPRDPWLALGHARRAFDRRQVPAARLSLPVSSSARDFAAKMAAQGETARPPLAFWEHYALRHLKQTRPGLGLEGSIEALDDGRVGLRVAEVAADSPAARAGFKPGDLILTFDGNPFFAGDDPQALLDLWCLREEFDGAGPALNGKPVRLR